ncbi:MAG TPA: FAD-dependent oxidoreductase [Solirubrobacteraceae bacterium]|nr:FAD-dependent oxidoreductase [Solirubrobacteraceae bacterium]
MSGQTGTKTRVAIIGGGPAALAAAFELTATPELERKHEITIYQPGWRLGGKCASGRNQKLGNRIEEHGLHVWFGCYDNAFSIIRRCYAELARDKQADALPTWRHALKPCHEVVVWDRDGAWAPHAIDFPPTPGVPGTERQREFTDVLREVLRWIDRRLRDLVVEDTDVERAFGDAPRPAPGILQEACRDVGLQVARVEHLGVSYLLEAAARLAERHLEHESRGLAAPAAADLDRHTTLLEHLRDWMRDHLVAALPNHPELRLFAGTVDLAIAAITGILKDGLLIRGFDAINDQELSDWLIGHGAQIDKLDPTRNSPFLRGVYDGSFAFVDGDTKRPNMAAGRAIQGAIRCLFHYNGSVLWRLQAGMGDAVIAPLYEVLEQRGVRIAFFHAVEQVGLSDDRTRVEKIETVRQAAIKSGEYSPLIDVDYEGRPLRCWPDRALFDQLVDGNTTKVRKADFEHTIDPVGNGERATLVADRDFDVAILAVPPLVQEEICAPLREADPRYAEMLTGAKTVITQAVQLWLDRTPQQLGWRWDCNSLMSMYVEPIDTYCDMSHLLPCEDWPAQDSVKHIAYFCGVIPTDEATNAQVAEASVHGYTADFLEHDAGRFWPGAATNPDGTGFDWDRLVAPAGVVGPDRLSSQYLRVNHQAAERYVLTLAGTVDSRLWPSERRFANLVFAGDWTRNGFDAGCVEAAMTSGMLAAQAICGAPADDAIAGLNGPTGFPNRPRAVADGSGDGDGNGSLCETLGHGAGQVADGLLWGTRELRRMIRLP